MLINKSPDIKSSEITDEQDYVNRRKFIKFSLATVGGMALNSQSLFAAQNNSGLRELKDVKPSKFSTVEKKNSWENITTYNNFYEFGTGKDDPADYAHTLKTKPWKVEISGHCNKPGNYDVDDIVKNNQLEERIYRLRCVEAWSMVVPWIGIPLSAIINKADPTSKAKYVEFTTLNDPKQMPGLRSSVLPWPYIEGLRMDEAKNPLTLLAVGLYGRILPNQNGAPIRLVVPWKYGFKSIKSIVKIRFVDKMPRNTWNVAAPREYGFFANVNPNVDHPRWSQKRERRLGNFFKQETDLFNGYTEQVGQMYSKLDLNKWF
ncbi:MAG: protein-methionine-sulfoxide reductase catalytic subunit MsrP [Calditrichaeota bacterium]|nr:MAG: protein-methionine-sulfoxide reductase catalytic subunit MsrP [Calditrichota bacterium]MBL1207743.1 protein-methionine-sulfoxide reductase catalytic subunit MsrP [Calditrichota bacterium]NOG47577.1 protein-methionine-sulfoxide reductase catalytic subunit MsrP [Calditrichota bacterium]